MRDSGEVLGAGESEGGRNGENGSLETHVCCGVWWVVVDVVVVVVVSVGVVIKD